jgi:histone H3/H4
MAKKKAKKSGGTKKPGEILIVQSKVRDHIKGLGEYNIAGDVMEALSARVSRLLEDAVRRANDNGRKTVKGRDI